MISIIFVLVLVSISIFQLYYNYKAGADPQTLPQVAQCYIRKNIKHASKEVLDSLVVGIFGILIIVAYPITYIFMNIVKYTYPIYQKLRKK